MVGDLLQPTHLLFVLVVALLVLGPKRLPEVGRALGRGLRDFRTAISGEEPPTPNTVEAPTTSGSSSPAQAHDEPPAPEAHDTPPASEPAEQTEPVTTSMRRDTAA